MPFVFVVIGILFIVVAVRGTQAQMFALLKSEFIGQKSFIPWAAAIFILGAIGYAKPIRPISDAGIGLIILVMVLGNKGNIFATFNQALANPVSPKTPGTALTPAGAALAAGTTLPAGTANADAASLAQQRAAGATPNPTPAGQAAPSLWQQLFGSSPAY